MPGEVFQIGAAGIDVDKIVAEVRETVARKMASGDYSDSRVARAERMNLANLRNEEDFLRFYLEGLRDAVFVDISDFEIIERRARFSSLLILLKKTLWKLLKFYTYRLWSQQNQVNGLLLAAIEGLQSSQTSKMRELEDRIKALESQGRKG
jgi:hypothetical protein